MKCAELMNPPEACQPQDSLQQLLAALQRDNIGSIPIVDSFQNWRPMGVVTDRDAALFLGRTDRRASEVTCREVMTTPVISCEETDDVKDAVELMRQHKLRRILVTNHGKLTGIISQADLARQKSGVAKKLVEDVSQAA